LLLSAWALRFKFLIYWGVIYLDVRELQHFTFPCINNENNCLKALEQKEKEAETRINQIVETS